MGSFDTDLPTECDDEYWAASDAGPAFKQPPGKPSKVAFFNCFVRLHQILAFAMRTIVSRSFLPPSLPPPDLPCFVPSLLRSVRLLVPVG